MPVSLKLIEHPTDDQIEQSVNLLIRAFSGDVSVDSMTGGNKDLQGPLFRSMLKACAIEGTFYAVLDDASGAIHSIGAWFAPGQKMFSSQKQQEQGWTQFFGSLPSHVQKWWLDLYLPKSEGELNKLLGENYLNGWFGNIMATDPPFQRRGYATAIVKAVFDKAAAENKVVALATQTDENAVWYRSLGFKQLGFMNIPADTGDWPYYTFSWEGSDRQK